MERSVAMASRWTSAIGAGNSVKSSPTSPPLPATTGCNAARGTGDGAACEKGDRLADGWTFDASAACCIVAMGVDVHLSVVDAQSATACATSGAAR